MFTSAEFKCPYCNKLNKINIELGSHKSLFIYCDSETGGCDRQLVFKPVWDIKCFPHIGTVPWEGIDPELFDNENDVHYCPTCGENRTDYGETCIDCLEKTIG